MLKKNFCLAQENILVLPFHFIIKETQWTFNLKHDIFYGSWPFARPNFFFRTDFAFKIVKNVICNCRFSTKTIKLPQIDQFDLFSLCQFVLPLSKAIATTIQVLLRFPFLVHYYKLNCMNPPVDFNVSIFL